MTKSTKRYALVRPVARTALAALLAMSAAACGNNVDRESSNRGSGTDSTLTTIDNAFIIPAFTPGSCAIQVGDSAQMSFTATNSRPAETERLLEITTAAANMVRIAPAPTVQIGPKSSIAAGQPIEHPDDPATPDTAFTVTVQGLKDTVRPGISVPVTFRFEKSGTLDLRVPLEACPTQK
jgi:hypothetical protein